MEVRIEECFTYLQTKIGKGKRVDVLIVCGSGLGDSIASLIEEKIVEIPYGEIPNFPQSTIPGHVGKLIVGLAQKKLCAIMKGRFHYYEGYEMQEITLPIRVMSKLGISAVILTNASGSVNFDIRTGDLVLIADHIAFPCLAGISPLRGPNIPGCERFPGLTNLWHRPQSAQIRQGVYGFISGPQFETPAEVRALRMLGIDIVGMSTVPEAIVAKHAGIKTIIGLSLVTNECIDHQSLTPHEPSHKEVLMNSSLSGDKLKTLIGQILLDI